MGRGGSERRRSNRQLVVCAVELAGAQRGGRIGVSRDLSREGTLVLSNTRFEIGERLKVSLHAAHRDESATLEGRVVRLEDLGVGGQWRYGMAVAFAEPLPMSEEEVLAEFSG